MSTLYFLAFCGVCAVVLGTMIDAIIKVSRAPEWNARQQLAVSEERVVLNVPAHEVDPRHSGFVGLTNNEDFQMTA